MFVSTLRRDWFSNPRADILAGILVALALIPEAIAFSIIAGVDPRVGLYASFSIAVIISFVGGRPGMISAATAAIAVLVVPLVQDYGVDYLFAATILMGLLQVLAGFLRLDLLMQYVSRSVVTGFVNALAILIFMAQLPQLTNVTWITYAMVAAGLAIIYLLPRLTTAIPSPLIAIIVLTIFAIYGNLDVRTVGDMGELPSTIPSFLIPNVPLTFETLQIILPFSLTMAAVGLLESMMTAQIVDDLTDSPSDKRRECRGQGIANFVTGFFGGMGGCAMIGQSVINVKSGGRGRLSTFVAGTFLIFLIIVLGALVVQIPMHMLVGIMIMVSIGTFDWGSFKYVRKAPRTDAIVMLVTVIIVVATSDLSKGVIAGVILSAIFFVAKISKIKVEQTVEDSNIVFEVNGQLFFASVEDFLAAFDFSVRNKTIIIDFSNGHVWDDSGVGAVDTVIMKYRENNNDVQITNLNKSSDKLINQLKMYDFS